MKKIRNNTLALRLSFTFFLFLLCGRATAVTISGFSPTTGQPGNVITITGSGFSGTTNLSFNNAPPVLGDFQIVSDSELLAVVPIGAVTGPLVVNATGGTGTSSSSFTAIPVVTSFDPYIGPAGTSVYISGANFVTGQTTVTFSGTSAVAGTVTSSTIVEATVPSGAMNGPITVTTSAGSGSSTTNFIASSMPVISGFSPNAAGFGTNVVITGANFSSVNSVKFGSASASFSVASTSEINATVPNGAATGPISVNTSSGTATTTSNFLTGTGPIITGFSPTVGTLDTVVTIDGLNLSTATSVTIGGTREYIDGSGSGYLQITITNTSANGVIEVTTPVGSTSTTTNFSSGSGPVISSFSPTLGGPGIYVVLNGINFTGASSVKFNGTSATYSVTSATQITATVPGGASTGDISVSSSSGTFTTTSNFLIEGSAPVITNFFPTNGVQGTPVAIYGANFTNLSSPGVEFNGVSGSYTTPTSSTVLYSIVPVGATSGLISVKNGNGTGNSMAIFYMQPWITNSPSSGVVNNQLIIQGRSLTNVSSLQIGGVNYSFTDFANELVTTVPSNAVSGSIVITAPGGIFISTNSFKVLPNIYSFSPTIGPAGTAVTISGTSLYGVTSVQFNGTSATPYNVGTNQLQVNVPNGATPGTITVVSPSGNSVSSNNFTATTSSKVVMTKTVNPAGVGPGTNVVYTILVTNEGPSTVTSLSVTDNMPLGFDYVSGATSQGTTSYSDNSLVAEIGILTNGTSATVTVTGTTASPGNMTNIAYLGFAEGNSPFGNNTAQAVAYFLSNSQFILSVAPASSSGLQITWPVSGANFTLQVNTNLSQPNGWETAPGNVTVNNGSNIYTGGFTNPAQFFRLIEP